MEIEGHTYAFPLAGATKANYLNPGGDFESVLSKLPCPSLSCHHDYHAVDMGLAMELVSGSEASEYGGTPDDLMYFSSGAPVVAFTSSALVCSLPVRMFGTGRVALTPAMASTLTTTCIQFRSTN